MSALLQRDWNRLQGVKPDLLRVVLRAREMVSFIVVEGLRTPERQRELFAARKSLTLNSKHLTGDAVDLAPWNDRDGDRVVDTDEIDWNDRVGFQRVAHAMQTAANELDVKIRWGGTFRTAQGKPWFDGPHFELV